MRRIIPRWRKATWALLIFNLLMLAWVISAISAGSQHATDCGVLDQANCDAARNVGTGIAVGFLGIIWFLGFVVLSLVWLMSRPRRRACPRCGNDVRRGVTTCAECGYDFAAAAVAPAPVAATPPAAPMVSPDGAFWWDGHQWQPMPPGSAIGG